MGKRILFIYPIIGTGEVPLNLSYLTAIAKNEGAAVRVFDTSVYQKFSSRVDGGQTSVGQFKATKQNISLRETDPIVDLVTLVSEFKPDMVCCTAFTNNFHVGLDMLKTVKKYFPYIPTMFGGIHTTLVPEKVIANDCVDMICVGEGEGVIYDICHNTDLSQIKNVWYKKDGQVYKNSMRGLVDLDTLPYQDFDGYEDYQFYRPLAGKLYRSISVDVSRGCPYKCSYCVNHTFQKMCDGLGKYHRVKSVEKAIGNLIYLKKKWNPELIRFWDEDFTTLPLKWMREFSKEYISHINLPFLIYARVDTMSQEKLDLLKDMGCITIAMGIESGSPEIRKKVLNRHMTNQKIEDSFKMVKKSGIRVTAYNMIGLPHESRKQIFETIEMNRRCKADSSSVAFLEPYQNTAIFTDCVDSGYITKDYVATFDFFYPHVFDDRFHREELQGLIKTFMLYVKAPKILWPIVRLCERGNVWIYKILISLFRGQ